MVIFWSAHRAATGFALVLLGACASELAERRTAAGDPANPQADEAPLPPAPNLDSPPTPAAQDSATAEPGGHHHPTTPPEMQPTDKSSSAPAPENHAMQHQPSPATQKTPPDGGAKTIYTCVMHPEVRQASPGKCPKCGMTLVPVDKQGSER